MKYLIFFCSFLFQCTVFSQIELKTDGIILPETKMGNVVKPVSGYFIYEPGYLPAIFNGKDWTALQNLIWKETTSKIVYNGTKSIGFGVQNPAAQFHFNAPDGIDPLRIQANGSTKFRIFDNGAIILGTNWQNPEENTLLINTTKTIVNDSLVLRDNSFILTENEGIVMYNDLGQETINLLPDLNGDGRVITNELELTGGSDLSEKFDVARIESTIMKPGMLVSIASNNGEVALCDTKRDKRVIGIISGANGIETGLMMGQEGTIADGEIPVALTGRAYVYANDENGSIHAGDFLTSSSTTGYAMRVKKLRKAQGAIIGKALTDLQNEEGFVLVLINLQ